MSPDSSKSFDKNAVVKLIENIIQCSKCKLILHTKCFEIFSCLVNIDKKTGFAKIVKVLQIIVIQ